MALPQFFPATTIARPVSAADGGGRQFRRVQPNLPEHRALYPSKLLGVSFADMLRGMGQVVPFDSSKTQKGATTLQLLIKVSE